MARIGAIETELAAIFHRRKEFLSGEGDGGEPGSHGKKGAPSTHEEKQGEIRASI